MRVLYDYQAFIQRYGGVSRYFFELMEEMGKSNDFEPALPLFFSDNQYLRNKRAFITHKQFKGKKYFLRFADKIISRRSLGGDYDLFHPTHYDPYFLKRLRKPFVMTVHDMVHELFPGNYIRDDGTARNKRRMLGECAQVIAVSERTKQDLCSLAPIPPERVSVVHHATRLAYTGGASYYDRPYLLFVGERDGYKNFNAFLEASARLLIDYDLLLVCAGGLPFPQEEKNLASSLAVADRVRHHPFTRAEELARLYRHAVAFVFPSLYEGFGIPILEAFACSCPAIISSASCFPEIARDGADYFDPADKGSIAAAVERSVSDTEHRHALARKGTDRLADFSWEKSAAKTMAVYRRALGK